MGTSVIGWATGAKKKNEIVFFRIRADLPDGFNSFALQGKVDCRKCEIIMVIVSASKETFWILPSITYVLSHWAGLMLKALCMLTKRR